MHDVVEDCNVDIKDIEREFGNEVAKLVDGVTKMADKNLNLSPKNEKDLWNIRKVLLFSQNDPRVAVIKIVDRLHNMRTIEFLPKEKQKKLARETLNVFAPVAHQLGMYAIKTELEDISFKILEPQKYERINSYVQKYKKEKEKIVKKIENFLYDVLKKAGVDVVEVKGRVKGIYSIWKKMEDRNIDIDEVEDILGFRVITRKKENEVQEITECWKAMGVLTSYFVPVKIDDYISKPKANGYRAIHITAIPKSKDFPADFGKIEIQIKSERMEEEAEKGICAHWVYKIESYDRKKVPKEIISIAERALKILKTKFSEVTEQKPSQELLNQIKESMMKDEIYVFTPARDVKFLPRGATVLDFAYSVHTELGHRCVGAFVNGVWKSIDHVLEDGDIVEVKTSEKQEPRLEWLQIAKTHRARQKIKEYLRKKERDLFAKIGESELKKEIAKNRLPADEDTILSVAQKFGKTPKDLYISIALQKIPISAVIKWIRRLKTEPKEDEKEKKEEKAEVKAEEVQLGDILTRVAKCCTPVEGDEIVGYVSRGKGIILHRKDCPSIKLLDPKRILPPDNLKENLVLSSIAKIEVRIKDIDNLPQITNIVRRSGVEIKRIDSSPENMHWKVLLFVKVKNRSHIDELISKITPYEEVLDVRRI